MLCYISYQNIETHVSNQDRHLRIGYVSNPNCVPDDDELQTLVFVNFTISDEQGKIYKNNINHNHDGHQFHRKWKVKEIADGIRR